MSTTTRIHAGGSCCFMTLYVSVALNRGLLYVHVVMCVQAVVYVLTVD